MLQFFLFTLYSSVKCHSFFCQAYLHNTNMGAKTKSSEQQIKILFVDDEPANIEIFRRNFADRYDILTASSGREALELFENNPEISIILSDYTMPGMNGVELIEQLHKRNPDTYRILITAFAEFENILEAIHQGHVSYYVIRPWDRDRLRLILEQAVDIGLLINENRRLNFEQFAVNQQLQIANEKLRLLSQKLVHAQEEERKRIAIDLQDDISQNLIAMKLHCRQLSSKLLEMADDDTKEGVELMQATLQATIDKARHLRQDLSPTVIEKFGFDKALQSFLQSFAKNYAIDVICDNPGLQAHLTHHQQQQVYRILQEVLNNIGSHSRTDSINLNFAVDSGNLNIVTTDFGQGFEASDSPAGAEKNHSLGFNSIQERAFLLGGAAEIESRCGQGTTVRVKIPLGKGQRAATSPTSSDSEWLYLA